MDTHSLAPLDFYSAWWLLEEAGLTGAIDVMVVRVSPITRRIEDDTSLNTYLEVWLETGPMSDDPFVTWEHDPDLDVGGATFEEAIIKMATKVRDRR